MTQEELKLAVMQTWSCEHGKCDSDDDCDCRQFASTVAATALRAIQEAGCEIVHKSNEH